MADIKSSAEIARQKLEAIGETTEEERLRWRYIPQGEKLAAGHLDGKLDFTAGLAEYEADVRRYILTGAEKVFIANINLPKNETARNKNEKVLTILTEIKKDKYKTEEVINKIRHIFNHFSEQGKQQRQQAHESLKMQFASRLQQALKERTGLEKELDIDVENLPQFKEEWQKVLAKMDEQYINMLREYRQELKEIK